MGIMQHRLLWVGLVFSTWNMVACGGAAPEPEPPPIESAPPPRSEPIAETPPPELDTEPSEAAQPSGEPASAADIQEALQVVLADDALQKALNLTEPGRFPVKIAGANLPSDLKVEVGSKPVELVPEPEDAKAVAVLVFTDFDLSTSSGSFRYRYDIDGMRGTSHVVKTGERWELKSSRLSGY